MEGRNNIGTTKKRDQPLVNILIMVDMFWNYKRILIISVFTELHVLDIGSAYEGTSAYYKLEGLNFVNLVPIRNC